MLGLRDAMVLVSLALFTISVATLTGSLIWSVFIAMMACPFGWLGYSPRSWWMYESSSASLLLFWCDGEPVWFLT